MSLDMTTLGVGPVMALGIVIGLSACALRSQKPATAGAAAGSPVRYHPAPHYTKVERTSQYVVMRDGVSIAVDLYLPAPLEPDARLPTILHQTRYWRSVQFRWPASLFLDNLGSQGRLGEFKATFVSHGYAWVDVDTRGSGASFGSRPWDYAPDEIRDGGEIVDWIIRQPWSNGKVGGAGASYGGSTAEFLLLNVHPAVKAIAPLFCEFDQYTDILAPGGVPHTWYFEDWGRLTNALDRNVVPNADWKTRFFVKGVRPVDIDRDGSLLEAALRDHAANYDFRSLQRVVYRDDTPVTEVDRGDPARAAALNASFEHLRRQFGDDFLHLGVDLASTHTYLSKLKASGAAVYAYSGWLDGTYQHAAIKRFLTVTNAGSKLLIGPWDHTLQNISPFSTRSAASFDHAGELLKFFDYHLKGIDTGIAAEPRVHYFTMGDERWKLAESWPPEATRTPYYLGAGRVLATRPPAAGDAADTYQVDVTAGTGQQTRWNTLTGTRLTHAYPDRVTQDQKLLHYTSAPLERDTEVTGHPIVTVYMSSTASDGAVFAYLEDVAPKGSVTYVTEGMLRVIHRKLSDDAAPYTDPAPFRTFKRADALPLVPGQVAELTFDLLPTSYVFKRTHRIRLALAGADRDHFAVLPTDTAPTLRFHRSADGPSRIVLPVVDRSHGSNSSRPREHRARLPATASGPNKPFEATPK